MWPTSVKSICLYYNVSQTGNTLYSCPLLVMFSNEIKVTRYFT